MGRRLARLNVSSFSPETGKLSDLTVGQALVDLLEQYQVDLVFGIPGTHSIELYRGLGTSKIRHISPRHEQGGGFMADGYARASGKPGICFVITGPGVTNICTPLGEAYMDSVPLLIISPVNDPDPEQVNRGRLHEITNQAAVTAPLTAHSYTVTDPNQIPVMIARAFEIFSCERPRPVHINIPLSIIPRVIKSDFKARNIGKPAVCSDEELAHAATLIENAGNPVIVAGGGCTNGAEAILQLAEKLYCPVLTTVAGRGILALGHPLTVGAQLRAPRVQKILENADLALFLGTEFAQTDHWNDHLQLPENQVWVNLCPHALEHRRPSAITIKADCVDFSQRMSRALADPEPERVQQTQAVCQSARSAHQSDMTDKEIIHMQVLTEIIDHIPEQTTIVSDMTQIAYTAVDYLAMSRPRQWLHPTGYGTLGYALPAAIGVVLANQSNPALALVGDAGLQYTMQEMTLASELNLNLVVLLWNNDALQQICDDMDNANIRRTGVFQKNPDFIAIAKACHWDAREVRGLSSLGPDLERAFSQAGPVLLELNEKNLGEKNTRI